MKLKNRAYYLIILLLFPFYSFAQQPSKTVKNTVLDPILYNGKLYSYSTSNQIKGTPFLFENQNQSDKNNVVVGDLKIKNQTYPHLLLNYDIYNQKLVMKFDFPQGGQKIIEVSDAWLQSFSIKKKQFSYLKAPSGDYEIFQNIGSSETQILYYWTKRIEMNSSINDSYYYYVKAQKAMYLRNQNQFLKFTNNRNFTKLLDKRIYKKIKTYLKQNKIKVQKASDTQMLELINFFNSLKPND